MLILKTSIVVFPLKNLSRTSSVLHTQVSCVFLQMESTYSIPENLLNCLLLTVHNYGTEKYDANELRKQANEITLTYNAFTGHRNTAFNNRKTALN